MSKKALLSILLIGFLMFGVGAGTFAWFTSSATSQDNEFEAGTLIVKANNGNESFALDLGELGNMQPGDVTEEVEVVILNDGSLDLAWFGGFDVSVGDGETTKLAEAIYIKEAKMEFLGPDDTTWLDADHFISNGVGAGKWPTAYNAMAAASEFGVVTLADFMANNAMGWGNGIQGGVLKPDFSYKFTFQLGFAELADDDYQGYQEDINPINVTYFVEAVQVSEGALQDLNNRVDRINIASPSSFISNYATYLDDQVIPGV